MVEGGQRGLTTQLAEGLDSRLIKQVFEGQHGGRWQVLDRVFPPADRSDLPPPESAPNRREFLPSQPVPRDLHHPPGVQLCAWVGMGVASARAAKAGNRKPAGRIGRGREWAAFIGAILYEPAAPPEAWAAGGGGGADRAAGGAGQTQAWGR